MVDIKGTISDIQSDISGLARHQYKETDVVKEPTTADRLTWAAIGGLLGLGGSIVTPKMIPKSIMSTRSFPLPLKIGLTLSGATAGYFAPDVRNVMIEEKKGDITREEARDVIREIGRVDDNVFRRIGEISQIEKEASFGIKKGFGFGFRQARRFAGTNIGKASIVGGLAYGGYRGIKRLARDPYKQNYTTFLRNQSLKGNINPSEMSQNDLIDVRKLGMN